MQSYIPMPGVDKWAKKSMQIKSEVFCKIETSHLIEKYDTENQTKEGYDIVDYIIVGF